MVERAEARVTAAEQEAAAEREQRRRVMEAAANGNLPLVSSPGIVDPLHMAALQPKEAYC